jgi:D-glycero-D-manno-heptose 1,7-bisphosphate phosphatase
MKSRATKVLYLDLDGTVRKCNEDGVGFVNKASDVVVYNGITEKLKIFKENGWRIVGITNQGGVSLGHLSFEDMSLAIMETQKQTGNAFDKIMACVHHPDAKDPEFSVCWCRKPRIGNIVESAIALGKIYDEYYPPHLALFVGDREEDKQCAENAGIRFLDAKEWRKRSFEDIIN